MKTGNKVKIYSWTSLAEEFGFSSYKFLKLNCKGIKKQLDECVGRENYRMLTPKQVELIRKHIDAN